jgi:hypothetical protein
MTNDLISPPNKPKARRRRSQKATIPFATATAGTRAREEIIKILRHFGAEEIGFSDNFQEHEVLLYFRHRGRQVHMRASAKGWAALWLRANPYSYRCRRTEAEYKQDALHQGHLAISSALREWIKGQMTVVETGILSFEEVFMPYMLTADGRPLIDHVVELLPKSDEPKVVALPAR